MYSLRRAGLDSRGNHSFSLYCWMSPILLIMGDGGRCSGLILEDIERSETRKLCIAVHGTRRGGLVVRFEDSRTRLPLTRQ